MAFQPDAGELIANDFMTPGQYADLSRGSRKDPEMLLVIAVLEDGIKCATATLLTTPSTYYGRANSRTIREAQEWIASDHQGVMSFVWCCEQLGIEHTSLRARINGGFVGRVHTREMPTARQRMRLQTRDRSKRKFGVR